MVIRNSVTDRINNIPFTMLEGPSSWSATRNSWRQFSPCGRRKYSSGQSTEWMNSERYRYTAALFLSKVKAIFAVTMACVRNDSCGGQSCSSETATWRTQSITTFSGFRASAMVWSSKFEYDPNRKSAALKTWCSFPIQYLSRRNCISLHGFRKNVALTFAETSFQNCIEDG